MLQEVTNLPGFSNSKISNSFSADSFKQILESLYVWNQRASVGISTTSKQKVCLLTVVILRNIPDAIKLTASSI